MHVLCLQDVFFLLQRFYASYISNTSSYMQMEWHYNYASQVQDLPAVTTSLLCCVELHESDTPEVTILHTYHTSVLYCIEKNYTLILC